MVAIFNPPENEIDFDSFTRFSLFLFRIWSFDVQPLSDATCTRQRIVFTLRKCIAFVFFVSIFTGGLFMLAYAIANSDDIVAASSSALDFLATFVISTKVVTAFWRKNDIWELFLEFKEISCRRGKENEKYGIKKYLDGYHFYMKAYAFSSCIIIFCVNFPTVSYYLFGEMQIVVKYWFPFDPFTPEFFPFYLAWSGFNAYAIVMFSLASDTLFYAFLVLLAMEFDILNEDMRNLSEIPKDQRMKCMRELTDHHNRLFAIGDKLQDIFSIIIFLGFCVSSVNFCFLAFRIILVEADLVVYGYYTSFLGAACGQILYLCFFGQKLIDASEAVTTGAYSCGWESFDNDELKKMLILTMARAQKPKFLTAMGFADVSLRTFSAVSFLIIFLRRK